MVNSKKRELSNHFYQPFAIHRKALSMRNYPTTYLLLFCSFLCCSKSSPTAINNPISGNITLIPLYGLGKTSAIDSSSEVTNFYLGDIKCSKYFYFLIENTGNTSLDSISISSSNSSFTVSPTTIEELKPFNQSQQLESPILKIGAIHGTSLDGIGYAPVMPKDTNFTNISIQGVFTNNSGSLSHITTTTKITVNCLLADFDLDTNGKIMDFANGEITTASTTYGNGLGFIKVYKTSSVSNHLINTGNVNLIYEYANGVIFDTLRPNDSLSIPDVQADYIVNTNNIIADPFKFLIGNDGQVYFGIMPQL